MRVSLSRLFGSEPPLIGVIHLRPLPGSPRSDGRGLGPVVEAALRDAEALREGGMPGAILENFGDRPFASGRVEAETVAAMTAVAVEVRKAFPGPLGVNVLRNDGESALAIAEAVGGQFVRVNVLVGTAFTDQGIIEGEAFRILRKRSRQSEPVAILADVAVKHATFLPGTNLEGLARDTWDRGGADAVIVTGEATGAPCDEETLRRVRQALPDAPVLLGSGVREEAASELAKKAGGAIVGTSLKERGATEARIDLARVRALVKAWKGALDEGPSAG